jgi:hypothetical protein
MNCGVCKGYLQEKNPCPGCRVGPNVEYCKKCTITLCDKREGDFCDCEKPCARLKQLDKRYREKYGMSMMENLENIKKHGVEKFIKDQKKKYISKEGVYCVHDKKHYKGGE